MYLRCLDVYMFLYCEGEVKLEQRMPSFVFWVEDFGLRSKATAA